MTYYIHPIWFYLMDVATTLKGILIILCILVAFGVISFIVTMFFGDYYTWEDLSGNAKKIFKKVVIGLIVALITVCFIPSQTACIEMMISSQVTHENVDAAKKEISEVIKDIVDYAKEFSEEGEE